MFEKPGRCNVLESEIEKIRHLRTKMIPVVVIALDFIKKGTKEFLDEIPGSLSQNKNTKNVVNSTAHVLRRALSI